MHPDVASYAHVIEKQGVELAWRRTGDDAFNELGFFDPSGQAVRLQEAPTVASDDLPEPVLNSQTVMVVVANARRGEMVVEALDPPPGQVTTAPPLQEVEGPRCRQGMGERHVTEDIGPPTSYGETLPGPHSCDWPRASKGWTNA